MTDRFSGLIVVLDRDIREDNAQGTIEAIKRIKGVIEVKPQVADFYEEVAKSRIKNALLDKIYKLFKEI